MILIIGQSNGEGADALPLLSITPSTRHRMLLPAIVNQVDPIGAISRLVESVTVDPIFANDCGETISSSMAKLLDTLASYRLVFSSNAEGGQRYDDIKKGTAMYARGLALISAANDFASAQADVSDGVLALCSLHGEADNAFHITDYADDLMEWWTDYNADLKDISGQSRDMPILACQHDLPTNIPTEDTRWQLLQAHKENPGKIVCVGPRYHLRHVNGLHLVNHSQRQHGLTFAKVLKRVVTDSGAWEPVRPASLNRVGAVITIVFHVPVSPLVFDRVRVFDPNELYGFEYYDDDTSAAIQSVALTAPDTVQITLDGTPTGANKEVRYAWADSTILGGLNPGPLQGRRGCLRDSDPTTSNGYESFNWCCHFAEPVN